MTGRAPRLSDGRWVLIDTIVVGVLAVMAVGTGSLVWWLLAAAWAALLGRQLWLWQRTRSGPFQ